MPLVRFYAEDRHEFLAGRFALMSKKLHVQSSSEFIRFGAMDFTKPYEFIRFGAMDVTKPYEFIGFGTISMTNTTT